MLEFEYHANLGECINPNAYQNEICFFEEQEEILNIARAINNIDYDKDSFGIFELDLFREYAAIIDTLKPKSDDFRDYYYSYNGNLTQLQNGLSKFIKSFTQDDSYELSNSIIANIDYMLKAIGYEYCNIRATYMQTSTYWHIDKSFDEVVGLQNETAYADHSHSFIFTLKGAPTKFILTDNQIRTKFYSIAENQEFVYGNETIDAILSPSSEFVEAKSAVFTRSSKYGAIHTSPEANDRFVFVITPILKTTMDAFSEYNHKKYIS